MNARPVLWAGAAVERRLVFLNPGLLVGADIVRAPDGRPHRAEQFFHFGPGVLTAGADAAFWQGARTCAQLRWLSGQQAACFAAPCARVYNHLDEAPALWLEAPAAGVTALLWVLSLGGACEAELLPVSGGTGRHTPSASAGRRAATTPACSVPAAAPATGRRSFSRHSARKGYVLIRKDFV